MKFLSLYTLNVSRWRFCHISSGNRPKWFKPTVNSKYEHNNNSFQSLPHMTFQLYFMSFIKKTDIITQILTSVSVYKL